MICELDHLQLLPDLESAHHPFPAFLVDLRIGTHSDAYTVSVCCGLTELGVKAKIEYPSYLHRWPWASYG